MGWVAGIVAAIALVSGLWWYLKRAMRVSAANDARHDFQRNLLLDLQDIRDSADGANGGLAVALDELIGMARHDTPASNSRTSKLDKDISDEIAILSMSPSVERTELIKRMLVSRNRRAKQ